MATCKDCSLPVPDVQLAGQAEAYAPSNCPGCGAVVCVHMDLCWPCYSHVEPHNAHPWSCRTCAGLPLLGRPVEAEQLCSVCLNGALKPPCKEHR